MKIKGILLLFFLVLISCQKDQNGVVDVHPEFEVYVQRFKDEANKRGKQIDFADTGLSIQFRDAVDTETGGVCRGNYQIEIEKFHWDDLTDLQREGLIFHELGHCELGRGHRNDTLPNGEWASRMRGDPVPDGMSVVINYTGTRREYYIDELFDEGTSMPDWATLSANFDQFTPEEKEIVLYLEEAEEFEENMRITLASNFEIDFEIDPRQSESWVGVRWGGREVDNELFVIFTAAKRFFITSGQAVFGSMREVENFSAIQSGFNRITVRKVADKYFVFVNKEFAYWFDYKNWNSNTVKSHVSGSTKPLYRNFTVSLLPPQG